MTETPASAYLAPALQRGLAILELFTPQRREWTMTDIAAALGVSLSSAYRLVFTLEHLGYLERGGGDKRYRLAARAMQLGFHYVSGLDIVEAAIPFIDGLRDTTRMSAHLAILDATEIVYVYRAHSHMTLASHIPIGCRLPAHATAMGRILLGGLADTEIAALYDGRVLEPTAPDTPTTLPALLDRVADARQTGWTENIGTFVPGMIAIAAPVRDLKDEVVASINLSGPHGAAERPEDRVRLLDALLAAAEGISRQLGWMPGSSA